MKTKRNEEQKKFSKLKDHIACQCGTKSSDHWCSNHMTSGKYKFINLEKYDWRSMKFIGEEVAPIGMKEIITIDGKHMTDDVNYIEVLRNTLLSVS